MNGKRREIPVTSPERELQWYCYSPSLFLASTANRPRPRPRPLSSFDIHARWRPVSQSILSRRYHVNIGDCEQSIDVSESLLKRDTFTLILESDHLYQPTYNLNIILWSSLTGGSTMYVCLFPAILKKNKKKASESGLGLEIEKFLFISKGTHPRLHLMTWTTCMYAWTAKRLFTAVSQ